MIENFTFHNPTRLIYTPDCWLQLISLLKPYRSILALIDQNLEQIYQISQQLHRILPDQKITPHLTIASNTEIESVYAATRHARLVQADFILAIGGGSTIDAAKFVACAYNYPTADLWQILLSSGYQQVRNPLAMGSIVTYPSAGSEMNPYFVASNQRHKRKIACYAPMHHPEFSILDPRWLESLSTTQIAHGVADSMIHIFEQFITNAEQTYIQNYQAASLLRTLIRETPNYIHTRSSSSATNLMLCATLALNGLIECGVNSDWTTHWLSHEITALYGITHAAAVVALYPSVIRCCRTTKQSQLLNYAQLVWDTPTELTTDQQIDLALDKTWSFWHSLGLKLNLSAHHIQNLDINTIIANVFKFSNGKNLGESQQVSKSKIRQILACAVNFAATPIQS